MQLDTFLKLKRGKNEKERKRNEFAAISSHFQGLNVPFKRKHIQKESDRNVKDVEGQTDVFIFINAYN